MVKIKRSSKQVTLPECKTAGFELLPLDGAKSGLSVSPRVIGNTYFKVASKSKEVAALVTVMPDGLHVAWDTCGKCHDHVSQCSCSTGIYHPSSVGWIRATYDVKYPSEKVTDYSRYFDPYGRNSGKYYDPLETALGRRNSATVASPPKKPRAARIEPEFDPSSISMEELQVHAEKKAKSDIRRARSVIRGSKR